jgi:hypothetical protein
MAYVRGPEGIIVSLAERPAEPRNARICRESVGWLSVEVLLAWAAPRGED